MKSGIDFNQREGFGRLLVTLEHDLGTRDTCTAFLDCFRATLSMTRFRSTESLCRQISHFYQLFLHCKPRMAIVQYYLDRLMETVCSRPDGLSTGQMIRRLCETLEVAIEDNHQKNSRVVKQGVTLIHSHFRILVHSHSHTVLDTLMQAARTHKKFEVIVAEQEAERTLAILQFLRAHDIPFVVVPEYMLSHLEQEISCMLVGAVTLKHDLHFVVDAGTRAIVSEMNSAHVPVYLLLASNKFSFWKTRHAHQTLKTVRSIRHEQGDFDFERIKFSHDRLPLSQVDKIITEEGVFSQDELRVLYAKTLTEYQEKMVRLEHCHRRHGSGLT